MPFPAPRSTVLALALLAAAAVPALAADCDRAQELYRRAVEEPGSFETRESLLLEAARLCPNDPCLLNDLGDLYELNGRFAAAEREYGRALAADPTFTAALLGEAVMALTTEDWETAARLHRQLLQAAWGGPACPELRRAADERCFSEGCNLARSVLAFRVAGLDGDALRAERRLQDMRGSKKISLALRQAAKAAAGAGHDRAAIRDLRAALVIEPESAWIHDALGQSLGRLDRWPEAQARFEEALRLLPGWAEAAFHLGHAHYVQGHWADAADTYEAAWSWSNGRVNERLLAEQRDAERRIGRSGVLRADLIAQTIQTKGIGLRIVHDDLGTSLLDEKQPEDPIEDPWPDEEIPEVPVDTRQAARWGDSTERWSCNPAAPMDPIRGLDSGGFDIRVQFEFDSDRVLAASEPALDELARGLTEALQGARTLGIARVELLGHADCVGAAAYNDELSRRRAQSVAAELSMRGVPSSLLDIDAFGFERPRASNRDASGRAQNRRVEVRTVYR